MTAAKLDLEESFTSWLAACDEMLATGLPPSTLDDVGLDPHLQARLGRGVSCLERLRELWPAPADEPSFTHAPATTDASLTRLGKFEIRRELGRGGFGVVYLAHDTELGRDVALKIPRLDVLISPELRTRFHHEALAAARLDHPLIVPVYEAGAVGIVSYIAAAYCPGATLAAWLKERKQPVPWRDAATLVADLADAVHHAHTRGVLHRDLKPGNILLQNDERGTMNDEGPPRSDSSFIVHHSSFTPKITDFGLARLPTDGGKELTLTGTIVGTASYMAPEQAEGKSREIGTATDVYGLGAILYELLTGRPPFQGDSVLATLERVRTAEPPPPRRARPDMPRDLQTICLKCLRKDPAHRYPAACGLAEDLRRLLHGAPIRARPASLPERAWKWTLRHPAWAAVLLIAVIGLSLAAIALDQQRRDAVRQRKELRDGLREFIAGADYLVARQSPFDDRPGVPHNAFTNLERLYADLEAAPENARDPDMRHELARASRLLGAMHRRLGNAAAAETATSRAIDRLDALVAEFPEQRAYQVDLAVTLCMQADATTDPARRASLLDRAIAVVQRLADTHPDQPEFRRELARLQRLATLPEAGSDSIR